MTPTDRRAATLAALQPYIERARSFSGWSFDDLEVRDLDPPPPWDYEAVAREHVVSVGRVLDLGTGGGEVFSRILDDGRARAVATEEWHVNAPVARDRLRLLGVDVVRAAALALPLRDAMFHLVLSRHEAVEPSEVVRVLSPGGTFVTQQVDAGFGRELDAFFPRRTKFEDHFTRYAEELRSAGCEVRAQRHTWRQAYGALGDIVYVLLVAPWDIPDFDAERDLDALIKFEDSVRAAEGLVLTAARYLIVATKPT